MNLDISKNYGFHIIHILFFQDCRYIGNLAEDWENIGGYEALKILHNLQINFEKYLLWITAGKVLGLEVLRM